MTEQRTRTPPDIKWLANELAAVAGELETIEAEMTRLSVRRTQLLDVQKALTQVTGLVGAPDLGRLVPSVNVHRKYGGRGRLREWLKLLLQEAAPGAVDTPTMVRLAQETFHLTLASSRERDRFRNNTLARQLRWFRKQGLVERVHEVRAAGGSVGVWRWKTGVPTVDALAEQDARAVAPERGAPWL